MDWVQYVRGCDRPVLDTSNRYKGFHCFTFNGTKLRGLHPTLRKKYWPNTKLTRYLAEPKPRGRKWQCPHKSGSSHGKYVHKEIEATVVGVWIRLRPEDESLRIVRARIASLSKSGDPCVRKFFRYLLEKRFTPVCSELAIHDEDKRLGTAVDLIALDENLRVVVIEITTTSRPEAFVHFQDEKPKKILKRCVPNTPIHRKMTQLMITYMMLRKKWRLPRDSRAILVALCPYKNRPDAWELPQRWPSHDEQKRELLYEEL